MENFIPLYPPNIPKKSLNYLKKCVDENMVSTGGNLINVFESKISKITSSKYAIAFNSGTAALHIALKVIGAKENDEIIVPTLTFIATINSVIYNKCSPIFMDSTEDYNIDIKKVTHFLNKETTFKKKFSFNKKTKKRIIAIIVTHVWGNAVDIFKLKRICKEKNIKIIEDASESLGTFYKKSQKHTGTLGDVGVLSFNANKIITTGGGGILLTNKAIYSKLAKYYSTQAKDDPIFFVHNDVGYNYRMTNISAALGLHQLIELAKILKKKENIRNLYLKYFKNKKNVRFFQGTNYSKNNNWMNIVRINLNKKTSLKKIINLFEKKGVQVRPVWKLNHTQKPFKKYQSYQIKIATELVKNSLCLPSSINLSKKDILRITNLFNLHYE